MVESLSCLRAAGDDMSGTSERTGRATPSTFDASGLELSEASFWSLTLLQKGGVLFSMESSKNMLASQKDS